MKTNMRLSPSVLLAVTLAGALMSLPQSSFAVAQPMNGISTVMALTPQDDSAASAVQSKLDKSQFKDVKVSVDNGIATLSGSVSLALYKTDAEKRVLKAKGVSAVRNMIEVEGPSAPDSELQTKLSEALAYDRVGYGNAFNAITIQVENGVVTLGGHARTYVDRDSAVSLVSTTKGVKDVVNQIEVDPVSLMDDQTRLAVARAVYGYPSLNKYAIDPAKPIRISVQNGNVELYGTVDSQSDKDTAYIRANGVSGVFSVKNYLQVANQPNEAKK